MKPGTDHIGIGVGACIRNDAGELLLIKRGPLAKNEKDCWALPGGGVEYGETLRDALCREIREELGMEITVGKEIGAFDHIYPELGQHWVAVIFEALITSGTPRICEPGKHSEVAWFALNALPAPIAKMSGPAIQRVREIDN